MSEKQLFVNDLLVRPATEIAVVEPRGALADLRANAMSLPREAMLAALSEYKDRRVAFRDWLRSQLVEGVHYGFPPGCRSGNADPKQWASKPSLYKAGAEFVSDLMGLRAEYGSDDGARACLGAKENTFVVRCRLVSRANGEFLGEGLGARKVGVKSMDENASLKMAQKSALVCSILNTYGLSDLFTQDVEDAEPPPCEAPAANANAPKANARNRRLPAEAAHSEKVRLYRRWMAATEPPETDKEKLAAAFHSWIFRNTGKDSLFDEKQWTEADVQRCDEALNTIGGAA